MKRGNIASLLLKRLLGIERICVHKLKREAEKNSKIVLLFTSINCKPLCLKLVKLHRKGKKKEKLCFYVLFFHLVDDALHSEIDMLESIKKN